MARPHILATSLVLGTTALALLGTAPANAAVTCDRVASPTGSDSAAGTEAAPWRTISKLTADLPAGRTGCLRQGSYGGGEPRLHKPDVEITSFPGEQATVTAMIEVFPAAARTRIHHLKLDATNTDSTASLKVQADDTVISDNDITKGGRGICVQAASWTSASRIVFERNRIHDCGPADSKFDHNLYLEHTRNAVVRNNVLSGNGGGWGVHLYNDADGTIVEHNIIDGNRGGVIFAGDGTETSDNNVVRYNAITNSGPRWNVESSWETGRGAGNSAHHNCLYTPGQTDGGVEASDGGFGVSQNEVQAGSPYVNRAAGDLRFKADTECARLVGDVAGPSVASPATTGLSLRPRRPRVKANHLALLSGKLLTNRRAAGSRVKVQVRSRGAWRTLAVTKTRRSGRFAVRLRAGKALRAGTARRSGTARLRAVVKRVAKSRTVRLKVAR